MCSDSGIELYSNSYKETSVLGFKQNERASEKKNICLQADSIFISSLRKERQRISSLSKETTTYCY